MSEESTNEAWIAEYLKASRELDPTKPMVKTPAEPSSELPSPKTPVAATKARKPVKRSTSRKRAVKSAGKTTSEPAASSNPEHDGACQTDVKGQSGECAPSEDSEKVDRVEEPSRAETTSTKAASKRPTRPRHVEMKCDISKPAPAVSPREPSPYFEASARALAAQKGIRGFLLHWFSQQKLRLAKRIEERNARMRLGSISGQADEKNRQRRNLLVCVLAILGVSSAFLYTVGEKRRGTVPVVMHRKSDYRIAPDAIERQSFQRQYEERLEKVAGDVKALTATLDQLNARLKEKVGKGKGKHPERQTPAPDISGYRSSPNGLDEAARLSVARASVGRLGRLTLSVPAEKPAAEGARLLESSAPLKAKSVLDWDEPLSRNRAEGAGIYLPAGTFAKTVVLSGVTAPTGGTAAQSPIPMLLEVTDFARLPNTFRSELKRCFITANATGDLSSERVWIRLDRLSCMRRKGDAIDVRIQGYATGEDGKTGARARLVTRSGQAIANALFLGAVSGLGKAVSLSAQTSTTSTSGTVTSSVNDPWAAGLGKGIDDATNRIVNYYIKLADKIFPVLELDSGRRLDIVLSQGVRLGPSPGTGAPREAIVTRTEGIDVVPSNSSKAFSRQVKTESQNAR